MSIFFRSFIFRSSNSWSSFNSLSNCSLVESWDLEQHHEHVCAVDLRLRAGRGFGLVIRLITFAFLLDFAHGGLAEGPHIIHDSPAQFFILLGRGLQPFSLAFSLGGLGLLSLLLDDVVRHLPYERLAAISMTSLRALNPRARRVASHFALQQQAQPGVYA